MLALTSWGLTTGNVSIQSGDTSIGGEKQPHLTSEFANALMLPMVTFLFYSFFIAVAAGMAIPRDDELRVGPVIHATRLEPDEYIWGKFLAVLATFLAVLVVHLGFAAFCNHIVPNENADKIRGAFAVVNYVRPALLMALPFVIFLTGASLAIGEMTRRPILVFFAPVALLLASIFFLWEWSPSWLDPRWNRVLMWLEPSGYRWINETWMKVDLGVDHYNLRPVAYDLPFLLSRLAYALLGIGAVVASSAHFARTLRGTRAVPKGVSLELATAIGTPLDPTTLAADATAPRLDALSMAMRPLGFLRTVVAVAKFEARNLRSQPGLYLFAPLILLEVIGTFLFEVGAFDTPLLLTPGTAAVGSMNTLTLLVCFLLLFYTTESVTRERTVRLEPVFFATPAGTAAILLGKSLANGLIGVVLLIAAYIGSAIVMLVQGKVAPDVGPFVLVWGTLLVPTFVAWATFVTWALALTGSRGATYAVGLAVLTFTGWKQFRNEMNWVGNWDLWSVARWTDFGALPLNGGALLLNRLFYIAITLFLIAWTVRMYPRREPDSGAQLDRLRPRGILRATWRLLPAAAPATALGIFLYAKVTSGFQGPQAEKREEEYRGRNLTTWTEAQTPMFGGVDLDLELDPGRRFFRVKGWYDLVNHSEAPMQRFPMSVGDHFEKIEWTLDGAKVEPEHRARLYVFKPAVPLAPGDTVRVGFSHEGYVPRGMTKNGGGMSEFILPVGVVLTSFGNSFVPTPFFDSERGVDEDNRLDPKDYEEGHWEGVTPPGFGGGARYPVRTRITGPEEYAYHAVGMKTEETTADGMRTVVWQTDHPVNFFNVVAGKWKIWKGDGVEVHYLPAHEYNVEEIGEALVASRRWYSEWFYPYPWRDLRLNEFAGLAGYAQGFPTNITFSENIGFLTRSKPETAAAFLVTAHEAAHQWWGNILLPGEGPGGNILSEGMAHFSTILLHEQVKGVRERIEFCKGLEDRYGDRRQVDSEKPLAWIDGSKAGDETATYDKGGWVAWMLYRAMGKDANLAGIQDFVARYTDNVDHPLMQDFTRVMREHAPDVAAYDEFVQQWIYEVVLPQYRVTDAKKTESGGKWIVTATVENVGTGKMAIEVAATSGERWPKESVAAPADAATPAGTGAGADTAAAAAADPYREARSTVVLGTGEKAAIEIVADFEPDEVVVDPDACVLMLKRERAKATLPDA
jgi:hypothetical protein